MTMADDPHDPMDGFGLVDLRAMLRGFEEALETARRANEAYEREVAARLADDPD
jgi:hypothetical protein